LFAALKESDYTISYDGLLNSTRAKLKTKGFQQIPGMATVEDEMFNRNFLDK